MHAPWDFSEHLARQRQDPHPFDGQNQCCSTWSRDTYKSVPIQSATKWCFKSSIADSSKSLLRALNSDTLPRVILGILWKTRYNRYTLYTYIHVIESVTSCCKTSHVLCRTCEESHRTSNVILFCNASVAYSYTLHCSLFAHFFSVFTFRIHLPSSYLLSIQFTRKKNKF